MGKKSMFRVGSSVMAAACLAAQLFVPIGFVQAASCNHKYAASYLKTDVRVTGKHDFKDAQGVWHYQSDGEGCTVKTLLDVYLYKCTECGANSGNGYTDQYRAHYSVLCPKYPIER